MPSLAPVLAVVTVFVSMSTVRVETRSVQLHKHRYRQGGPGVLHQETPQFGIWILNSCTQTFLEPKGQSRPQCLPFWWALGSRLGLNGLKPATRLRDVVLGKKTVFGIELTGVRNAGLSWKKSGITGSGSYFQTPFFSKCMRTCLFSIMSFPQWVLQSSQEKSKTMVMQNFGGQQGTLWSR